MEPAKHHGYKRVQMSGGILVKTFANHKVVVWKNSTEKDLWLCKRQQRYVEVKKESRIRAADRRCEHDRLVHKSTKKSVEKEVCKRTYARDKKDGRQ